MLAHSAQNYSALDSKALALCEGRPHNLDAAVPYQAARAIDKDVGVVARVLRLFDAVALVDNAGCWPRYGRS